MTSEQKMNNLIKHIDILCNILIEKGFELERLSGLVYDDSITDLTVKANSRFLIFTQQICSNKLAFNYLKYNGYFNIDICWSCGADLISPEYVFKDEDDSEIQFNICKECYNKRNTHDGNLIRHLKWCFSNSSKKQRCLIINFLSTLGCCDDIHLQLNPHELIFLHNFEVAFGVLGESCYKRIEANSYEKMFYELKLLNEIEKEHLINWANFIMKLDGEINLQERECCSMLMSSIGISSEDYQRITKKFIVAQKLIEKMKE